MATPKQRAANRRNARKSTGPRTIEGKAKAAQNSFKHGLLAKPALLPDENETEFRDFTEEVTRELDPVGSLESGVAQQIACQMWRLKRFPLVEAGLFLRDRAKRDHKHFWDEVMQYQGTGLGRGLEDLRALRGDSVQITDEAGHAEAMKQLSAAVRAQRSEPALLGAAFSSAATNGDPFGKLSRYETAALRNLRHLLASFYELQARRSGLQADNEKEKTRSR
jgi:hypothetical protein